MKENAEAEGSGRERGRRRSRKIKREGLKSEIEIERGKTNMKEKRNTYPDLRIPTNFRSLQFRSCVVLLCTFSLLSRSLPLPVQ